MQYEFVLREISRNIRKAVRLLISSALTLSVSLEALRWILSITSCIARNRLVVEHQLAFGFQQFNQSADG